MLTVDREISASVSSESRTRQMVEMVAPALQVSRAESETARRLAPEAMRSLLEAGVLRALIPAAYGRSDLGPVHGIRLFRGACSHRCGGGMGWRNRRCQRLAARLAAPQGTDEILAVPNAVINGSLFPPLVAERVSGGYRVSGRSSFASGCDHATWIQCQALLMEQGAPVMSPNGTPVTVLIHVPAPEFEVIDTWHTLGMCGTGSNDYQMREAFVPEHRAWLMGPIVTVNPAFSGALNRMGVWWFSHYSQLSPSALPAQQSPTCTTWRSGKRLTGVAPLRRTVLVERIRRLL